MAKLTLYTPQLTASVEDRVISGLLLPFGEPGHTNLGRLTASATSRLDLADLVPLNVEHKAADVIGKAVALVAGPDGLTASFTILATPAGDTALLEAAEGLRAGLSVEIEPIVTRAGQIVSGTVAGAALVARPAFPSARLAAAEVEDLGETDPDNLPQVVINGEVLEHVADVQVTDDEITITTAEPPAKPAEQGENMTAARVQTPALVGAPKPKDDANALFASLAAGFSRGLTGHRLEAALSDIISGDILGVEQPQYVGELWNGVPYERRFIPLFNHAALASWNIKGWQFKDGKTPEVAEYAGDKTDIPSGDVETEEVSGVLKRFAGGHDIDRRFRDFSVTEFWEAYFRVLAESYAKKSDRYVRDVAKAIPTAGNGGRVHLAPSAMPAGVPSALAMIVKGALKMLNSPLEVMPTFAMVTADYWEEIFYTPQQEILAYLSTSLNLKGGEVENFKLVPVPTGSLTVGGWVGKVLVGHSHALTVHELPGAPIRVEAEAIAKGGIDEALFGYIGTLTHNAAGLISYDAPSV